MVTVGIDEVGRGCWAGPVVAAAVILTGKIPGLTDSKKLSRRQRELLNQHIQLTAQAIGIGWVSPGEVDAQGLTTAVRLAMARALAQITVPYDEIIIDGNFNFLAAEPRARVVIRADATIAPVSAASIVAKVARDTYMSNLEPKYAGYDFAKHVGYGTAVHQAALRKLGVSDLHRQSVKPIRTLLA